MTAPDHLAAASEAARLEWATARVKQWDKEAGGTPSKNGIAFLLDNTNPVTWDAAFRAGYDYSMESAKEAYDKIVHSLRADNDRMRYGTLFSPDGTEVQSPTPKEPQPHEDQPHD